MRETKLKERTLSKKVDLSRKRQSSKISNGSYNKTTASRTSRSKMRA